MKAVVELTKQEAAELTNIYKAMKVKIGDHKKSELLNPLKQNSGYAHYTFEGEVTPKFIELMGRMPTTTEIIMLVDNGFSHFGATCTLTGGHFSGRVNTD